MPRAGYSGHDIPDQQPALPGLFEQEPEAVGAVRPRLANGPKIGLGGAELQGHADKASDKGEKAVIPKLADANGWASARPEWPGPGHQPAALAGPLGSSQPAASGHPPSGSRPRLGQRAGSTRPALATRPFACLGDEVERGVIRRTA